MSFASDITSINIFKLSIVNSLFQNIKLTFLSSAVGLLPAAVQNVVSGEISKQKMMVGEMFKRDCAIDNF